MGNLVKYSRKAFVCNWLRSFRRPEKNFPISPERDCNNRARVFSPRRNLAMIACQNMRRILLKTMFSVTYTEQLRRENEN